MSRYKTAQGFTLVELLMVVAIVGVLSAVAAPSLIRARMAGNEASAIGSLRAINNAEAGYSASSGRGGYATQLAILALPCPSSSVGFISVDLSTDPSAKSGYTIAVAPGAAAVPGPTDCNGSNTHTAYYATGVPISDLTGHRAFAATGGGLIFYDPSGVAPTEAQMAPGGGATPLQ